MQLVGALSPVKPQRITLGLNKNFTLSPSYSFHMSSYHRAFLFLFFSLFIFRGLSIREPASSRVTYFILRAYTETGVSHSQHRKKSGEVWKKCRWMDRKCTNKQERKKSLAVSVACMAIYWPTPGFKGRTFKLCVLTRWDFNFCVRGSPPRGRTNTLTTVNTHWQRKDCSR